MIAPDDTGCATCGRPSRDHIKGWMPGPGWHTYQAPTAEQIRARLRFPLQRTTSTEES
ncbi:hypothetical protein [Kitasatospora sp. A2-31]|uniref:hypothetical protein n=1 Tax=Kitasatospora sp. A2-31 TaxID=2916414 RepID=UPI001EED4F52|nr:hypothetical protein [Kitasatospora sp. A2-31]MCG6499422.1 hypothetical protein [Kitasatospora sp. A2-31]